MIYNRTETGGNIRGEMLLGIGQKSELPTPLHISQLALLFTYIQASEDTQVMLASELEVPS